VANATPYDVFISYARVDGRHAADIDSLLRAKGLNPFFDRRSFAPGLPWLRALEQVIASAKAALVLIGPHGLGNTQQYERELALIRQTGDQDFPIVPVILPGNRSDPPFDFLRLLSWIDFSHVARVSDAPDVLEQLLAAIHGREIAPEAAREAICPYRGLDAFREEDSAFFFGRGSADDPKSPIGELICKVREHPLVMVVGRSGSGKSSLVYAGLLPALRRERDRFWNVLSLRPGPTPLRALAAAFNPRAENEGAAEYAQKIINEANRLRTGHPELLCHMIREELDRAEGKPDRLLLYIDQWEELYAQAPSSSDKARAAEHAADVNRFIDLLLVASRSAPVAVVGTVRADFYDPLIGHQEIKSLLPTRQVLLGKMLRSELEQTVVEPAKKVGLTFDPPGLVQRILDEAGEDEGMLPLLQYALKETWARREGNRLTGDSYTRSGGVREAIRITAEQTFEALSAEDQQTARQLFLRLVTPGEGQEDTRARAAMPVDQQQRKIVEQFAAPRTRLLVTGFDRAARPTVEVAHEALIRTWPRLREWIGANREKMLARAAILQAKAEWEQHGRRDDLLLPAGFQLERARQLLADPGDLTIDDVQEFVTLSLAREASKQKEREAELARDEARVAEIKASQDRTARLQRINRWAIAIAGAMLLIAAVVIGLQLAEKAKEQAKKAKELATQAAMIQMLHNMQLDPSQNRQLEEMMEQMALGIQRVAAPYGSDWQLDLAAAYEKVGNVLVAGSKLDEALKIYRGSLAIRERLAGSDRGTRSQHDLSVSYSKIGDALKAQNNLDEALKAYRDGVAIAERLAASSPSNVEWQRDLSASYDDVADVMVKQGKLDEGLASYRSSLAIKKRLAVSDPSNMEWQRDLSVSYDNVGDVLMDQGKQDEALMSYQDSLAIRERVAASDRSNTDWQADLSISYKKLASAHGKSGNVTEALVSLRHGREIVASLVGQGFTQWKRKLAQFDNEIAALEERTQKTGN
jgi:tetratricopeptide (TPR) repeat protein